MRALKAVVLSLGALCVAAFGVLVYLVVAGIGDKQAAAPSPAVPSATGIAAPPLAGLRWNDLLLGQPPGTRIVGVVSAGGLLAIHVEAPGGAGSVLLVDPASGQLRGRIMPGTNP
jgi:hypothetical protein